MVEGRLELAEMIRRLRGELQTAMDDGETEALKFAVREVQLEVQVAVESKTRDEGGVKFWVVNASLGGDYTEKDVHTVRLTLDPKVGGRPAEISGSSDQLPT